MSYKFCQSCGMPMAKDPNKGGTNKDSSISNKYCSYCFKNGSFLDNFTTAKEMQNFCIDKLVEMKTPRILAWLLTRNIPKLERWNIK